MINEFVKLKLTLLIMYFLIHDLYFGIVIILENC